MKILEILAWFYLISLSFFLLLLCVGYVFENKIDDNSPLKKWWRKHIVGIDPEENYWKNYKR